MEKEQFYNNVKILISDTEQFSRKVDANVNLHRAGDLKKEPVKTIYTNTEKHLIKCKLSKWTLDKINKLYVETRENMETDEIKHRVYKSIPKKYKED